RGERLREHVKADPIAQLLEHKGMVRGQDKSGALNITCPFVDEHGSGAGAETSTQYFPRFTGGYSAGAFECLHSHCGDRTRGQFLTELGYDESAACDDEFEDLLKAALNVDEQPGRGDGATPSGNTYKVLNRDDLANRPRPKWMIKGVLPETGLCMLVGASTAGKSFVALDMAARISWGEKWFGLKTRKSPVVYVGLEGEGGIANRIAAIEGHHSRQVDASFGFILQPWNMLRTEEVAKLAAAIVGAGGKNGLIIIDTLSRATPGGDENSSVDMGKVIQAATQVQRHTGGVLLIVHHKGKSDAAGARGHSSLYGALDACIAVNVEPGGQRSVSTDSSRGGKSKDGQLLNKCFDLEYRELDQLDEDGAPHISSVVVECNAPARTGCGLNPAQLRAMEAYKAAATTVGLQDAAGQFVGVGLEAWRVEFYKSSAAENLNAKRVAFQRARNELTKLDVLSVNDDIYRPIGEDAMAMVNMFTASLMSARAGGLV
ncbi:MAG: AAA family ATPase, partial [Betaproteobacteria bacterium]